MPRRASFHASASSCLLFYDLPRRVIQGTRGGGFAMLQGWAHPVPVGNPFASIETRERCFIVSYRLSNKAVASSVIHCRLMVVARVGSATVTSERSDRVAFVIMQACALPAAAMLRSSGGPSGDTPEWHARAPASCRSR